MAKYKLKDTYSVEVKEAGTGKTVIEQRKYDPEKIVKKHGGQLLKPGMVVDLTSAQLEIHGEKFFEKVVEEPPATVVEEVEVTEESPTETFPDPEGFDTEKREEVTVPVRGSRLSR